MSVTEFFESAPYQITAFIISMLGFIFTTVGLVLTWLSLVRIQKVKNAQKEAQEQYKKLVGVQNIIKLLFSLKDCFEYMQKSNDIPASVKQNMNFTSYMTDISMSISTINAINSAFSEQPEEISAPVYEPRGYYDDDFFTNIVLNAKEKITIYCKRNTRVCKQENLHRLCEKAEHGCEIRIIAISPDMPDPLLEEVLRSVPNPPQTIAEIKDTQKRQRDAFLAAKRSKQRIHYYETKHFPLFHLVQVDNKVYWGLTNYDKLSETPTEVYHNRPYLIYDQFDPFAQRMLAKIDQIIKNECIEQI